MTLVIITGICALAVLFLLRFLVALCSEGMPGPAFHVLSVAPPARTGGDEPDAGETTGPLNMANRHAVRRRLPGCSPAATMTRWSPKTARRAKISGVLVAAVLLAPLGMHAQSGDQSAAQAAPPAAAASPTEPQWQYGGFIDAAYLWDFNDPSNHLLRSRGTAYKVDEPILNMIAAYARKTAVESSRWGFEVAVQGGQDTRVFGFSATAPYLAGSTFLRHLGPTDISYLAPVGKGLTLQAGIFSSLIGYDSLYAKDNLNYTRPWGADFTPYLMMGINASYPFSKKLTGTVFPVNDYFHLADPNSVPSSGAQFAYKASDHTTVKQTVLWGPHQSNTALEFWRFLSDSIVEWKTDRITTAFEYHVGEEKVTVPGSPRALWMAGQLPVHWVFNKHWSVTVRPEVYWDRDGRLTGFSQTVKANTTTLEYRIPYRQAAAIVRLEHRVDDSRGPGGGFFSDGQVQPGVVGLMPTQHLLMLGVILTYDASFHH
jgi:hypothetical protein